MNRLLLSICFSLCTIGAYAQSTFWEKLNGPYGAEMAGFFQSKQGTVFALGYDMQVFRSFDQGLNWEKIELPEHTLSSNALFSQNPEGELLAKLYHDWYISLDEGTSWAVADSVAASRAGALQVSPGHLIKRSGWNVFRSIDNGNSWSDQFHGSLYLSNSYYDTLSHTFYVLDDALHKSSDEGLSWQTIGPPEIQSIAFGPEGVWVAASDSAYLVFDPPGSMPPYHIIHKYILYATTDYGATWKAQNLAFINAPVYSMKVKLTQSKRVFLTVEGYITRYSDDLGVSWQYMDDPELKTSVNLTPLANNILLAPAYQKVHYSGDNGNHWQTVSAPAMALVDAGNFTFLSQDKILTAYGNGIVVTEDGGDTWVPLIDSASVYSTSSSRDLISLPNQIHLAHFRRHMYRSTDNGNSFSLVNMAKPFGSFKYLGGESVLLLSDSIYRSDDAGISWYTWQKMTQDFSVMPNGDWFAGKQRSTDQGQTWSDVALPSSFIVNYAANAAGKIAVIQNPWDGEVFSFSVDYGYTWTTRAYPPKGSSVVLDHILVEENGAIDIVLSSNEIFRTEDNGLSWDILPPIPGSSWPQDFYLGGAVTAIKRSPDGRLYVSNNRNGFWRTTQSFSDAHEAPKVASVTLTPNPTSGDVVMVSSDQSGRLLLYNHLGVLAMQADISAGQTSFSMAILPDGIYYWSLMNHHSGKLIQSGKLIKMN